MPMRLTGLMSGMDTESIIQELVAVKQTKVDDAKKDQTKLEWKQDKWKELNTKLLNLYQKTLSKMRFSDAYSKKTTSASNPNAVSIITGESAMNGVQTMEVNNLAKAGYMTGKELSQVLDEEGHLVNCSEDTTMAALGLGASSFNITTGGKTTTINLSGDSKISDVLKQLREAGVNANFDVKNQRFYISSKKSGEDNDFTITDVSGGAVEKLGLGAGSHKVKGENASITLNGATYTSEDNTFEVNGLTLTCLAENTGQFTVTTQTDTNGIYDMVKGFLKEYNTIINELDKLYNADTAKGYEPLTDEEKDSMSETEVEKWEGKVKDALFRRDSNVYSISSSLKEIMMCSGDYEIEVNGKKMHLSDFGIETLGYFIAPENEKNAYHIAGDPDDESTANDPDKLKSMIASDPDTVTTFFTALSRNLYDKMGELSASKEGFRSFNSFFDDKKMKSDYDDYTSKITELEKKLQDYEDKWYSKFSAMETAMAKMQQNASAVTALLGGS